MKIKQPIFISDTLHMCDVTAMTEKKETLVANSTEIRKIVKLTCLALFSAGFSLPPKVFLM